MDSQRSLFKKFFNSGSANNTKVSSESTGSVAGFNPPKFQFNKKKFGDVVSGLDSKEDKPNITSTTTVSMSEIESVEIESDTKESEYEEVLSDEYTAPYKEPYKESYKEQIKEPPTYTSSHGKHFKPESPNPSTSNVAFSLYNNINETHKQKYNLSNQIEDLTGQLEFLDHLMKEKGNRIDLLLINLDEKIAEMRAFQM